MGSCYCHVTSVMPIKYVGSNNNYRFLGLLRLLINIRITSYTGMGMWGWGSNPNEHEPGISELKVFILWILEIIEISLHNGVLFLTDNVGCGGLVCIENSEANLHCISFTWSSQRPSIVAFKVNCLSSEFAARKHGKTINFFPHFCVLL